MRSIKDIFRSHAMFNAEGKHTWGTDRESNHCYGDAYESLFYGSKLVDVKVTNTRTEPMYERTSTRDQVKLMMEIGVADGSSLFAWKEVFPNALIVGMDMEPPAFGNEVVDRMEFHLGDQRSREDCERVARGRQFDFIVDDASHQPADILVSLLWLWPHLRPGGLYVIEDLLSDLCVKFAALLSCAQVIDTAGPFGGIEPLIVLRKPQ